MDASVGTLLMILCYVFGTGLVLLEAFMPGFGIAGIGGIILEITAIILTNTYFGMTWSLVATFALLVFAGTAIFFSYRSAMNGRLSKSPLVLKNTENASAPSADGQDWLNRKGTALTVLRPAGFIEIDGTRLSASTNGEFLANGTAVKVTGTKGTQLLVQSAN